MTDAPTQHRFEAAGLGKAPYEFRGIEHKGYRPAPGLPMMVGGACAYCSTGISYRYWLRSADGKEFYVGSQCINKSGDAGLRRIVKAEERKRRDRKAQEQAKAVSAELLERLGIDTVRDALAEHDHPNDHFASEGKTLLDWAWWMYDNAGTAGKKDALKVIEKHATKEVQR